MLRWFAFLMTVCLFAGPGLAEGSEVAADCILERISSEDRVLLGEYALGSETLPTGLDGRLETQARACGDRLSLTGEQLDQAGVNVLARLVLERTRVRLEVAGIPVEALDVWFASQSEQFRANYGRSEMSDAEVEALTTSMIRALEARGVVAGRVREHAGLVDPI